MSIKKIKGVRYHQRENGTIHREYAPCQWEECSDLSDDVKHAFGVMASTSVILEGSLRQVTIWFGPKKETP